MGGGSFSSHIVVIGCKESVKLDMTKNAII